MRGEDFVALAGSLAARPSGTEAVYRTATSRAYYGAFHVACELLASLGVQASYNHADVQRALFRTGNSAAQKASYLLADLQSDRVKADYRLTDAKTGTEAFAKSSVESATTVIAELGRCYDPSVQESMRRALNAP